MNRREFLKYMTAFGAMTAGSNWLVERLWSMMQEGELTGELAEPPGIESWANSICRLCPGGCGVRVRLIDGLPVKIDGNPLYPVNRGGLCATGHAGLQILYNPDRLKGPMKRVGPAGSSHWQPISWEEALALIKDRLVQLRKAGHAHRMAFLDGGSRGLASKVFKQFVTAFGSPNYIRTDEWENRKFVYRFMQGYDDIPGFDLERARFVLSFGADLLEAEGSIVWFSRQLSIMRQNSERPRGSLVQIEPRMSVTAVKADKWVPVKVGSEGALALGIAYIMIQEELYNKDFVEKYTFGFDDWKDHTGNLHIGFKTLVLQNYYPEAVSRITGVPIEDIVLLARSFAANQPGVAICGQGMARQTNGFYAMMAVHALNALVGNLEKAGGVITRQGLPLNDWPEIQLDEVARLSLGEERIDQAQSTVYPLAPHIPENLINRILTDHPSPIEVLFLYKSNPVFEWTDPESTRKALEKIPLIISFSSFMDETSELAHLILPESFYLESWQDDFNLPYTNFDHFGISKPVIKPIGNTRDIIDVILSLANALGGTVAQSLPFQNHTAILKWVAKKLFESGRGVVAQSEFDQAWVAYLEERGWRYPRHKTFQEFWEALLAQGGWVDPVQHHVSLKDAFKTSSNKFEFYLLSLQNELNKFAEREAKINKTSAEFVLGSMVDKLKISARGDVLYLPHHEPARIAGDEFDYPYLLIPYELNLLGDGNAANAPMLLEMVGFRHYIRWNSWIEIHPDTARELGLHEGDWVWVQSPNGRIKTKVHIFPGAQPNMIYMPLGLGHTAMGRYAKNVGANLNSILVKDFDFMSGIPAKIGTRVKLFKTVV